MPRQDMFKECYAGEHRQNLSPENFKHMFCRVCRNPGCVNSAVGKGLWMQRMENQADRLLNNPVFGDPNDPKFQHLADQDFKDMVQKAMALEVSARKGDWEIPTPEDMQQLADEVAGVTRQEPTAPAGFQEILILWQTRVRSQSSKQSYTVALMDDGGEGQWSCTCPGFRHHQKCSHLPIAQNRYTAEQETTKTTQPSAPEPAPVVQAPTRADPVAWQQMRENGLVPVLQNTRFPAEGMMIDGSSPPPPLNPEPERDPWEAPKPKPTTVQVGSKVVLGGKK